MQREGRWPMLNMYKPFLVTTPWRIQCSSYWHTRDIVIVIGSKAQATQTKRKHYPIVYKVLEQLKMGWRQTSGDTGNPIRFSYKQTSRFCCYFAKHYHLCHSLLSVIKISEGCWLFIIELNTKTVLQWLTCRTFSLSHYQVSPKEIV